MSETATKRFDRYAPEQQAEAAKRVVIEKWPRSTYSDGKPCEKSRRRVVIDGQPVAYLKLPNGWGKNWRLVQIDGKELTYIPAGMHKGALIYLHHSRGNFHDSTLVDLLEYRTTGGLRTIEELQAETKSHAESVLAQQAETRRQAEARKATLDAHIATLGKMLAGEPVDDDARQAALNEALARITEGSASLARVIAYRS